jgi:Tfp pilus assembly protein PilF
MQIYNVLGLCSTCQGDIRDGVAAYERAVQLKPDLKEAWLNMGQVKSPSVHSGPSKHLQLCKTQLHIFIFCVQIFALVVKLP